ncbi:MAG: tRNA (mo5U34)-methyltransferase [Methanoregula sp. PtaU1.Bin051]|nr:MAG: tRNA (mo5U34)-methyltransferase [Methanoregula sp. PtaU1.Bin051]
MGLKAIFTKRQYLTKVINSLCPRIFFRLSPFKYRSREHWKMQGEGDPHGYDKYNTYNPKIRILINELDLRAEKTSEILDLGCNCGYYLWELKKAGYSRLSGVDISERAIEYGKKMFDLKDLDLYIGSFEIVLPQLAASGRQFDLIYTMGATVELVHPSFDIVRSICDLSRHYVILDIYEWGHSYPRFWEYEFNRQGFILIKCQRPISGGETKNPIEEDSLLVFKRFR